MADGRVTQVAIEVLSQPVNVAVRVTQSAIELLTSAAIPARVTQAAIEILSENLIVPVERSTFFQIGPV